MSQLLLLQTLLFMNFGGNSFFDIKTEHCFAITSGSFIGKCNRVCNVAGITDQEVIQIKNYFGETPFTWVVDAAYVATSKILDQHGLNYKGSFPAMIADLHAIKDRTYSDEVVVREIVSEDDFRSWVSIVSHNYHLNEKELTKAVHFFIARASAETIALYLGFYEHVPVGASMLIYHDDTVSLHMVGTLEAYRGRGVGYAISCKPLLDAYQKRYAQAVLMSSAAGVSLYQKLGFDQYAMYAIYGNY